MILKYLLKHSNFAMLYKFISPNLFHVLQPKEVFKIASELRTNSLLPHHYSEAVLNLAELLGESDLGVRLEPNHLAKGIETKNALMAERILKLFFFQVFNSHTWILDFSYKTFSVSEENFLVWNPSKTFLKIDLEFVDSIRNVYSGFYKNDDVKFDLALRRLHMYPAKESLFNHFGGGKKCSTEFKLEHFQKTFTDVFEECSKSSTTL